MAVRLYNEYIKVDPNFIPVFSRNSDRIYPDKWQSFYPHTSFKNILKDVVETLEKSNETKDRSIWMSGAYGTGKTYASFVIKHILEDSIDSITPYFIQNGMETLLARVKGVRAKGRILVVQRSASAGINTQDKLFNAIVESVRRAVSDAGLTYTGAESLSDKVLTILKHPETSAFNFQGAFNKYRGKFTEYSSVDSIVKDLEELDLEDNIVKVPYALLKELRPELITIVDQFSLIKDNAQFNKAETASTIANLADDFVEFFNNQYEVFCKALDRALHTTISADEYEYLFNKVPSGTLCEATDKFTTTMQHELTNFRKSKKTRKMYDAWEKATNSTSPADWSQKNGIPVLCLFTEDILTAQKIFDALNRTSYLPTEKDIDDAIDFLQSGKLGILKNTDICVKRFIDFFAGEYAYVITSADELRDQIRAATGTKVYDWYAKANSCKSKIRQFATERYQLKYRSQAKERVRKLTAEQAQKYLDELIDKDPLLGINILKG